MSGFDPSKLTTGGAKPQRSNRGPRAERVFLAVEEYQTPAEGFHYAIGHKVDAPDEKVKVRLNTVAERQQDRPNDSADKIKSQYVTGENTRDSLADKSKAGITLISFDDARKVGADENGVAEVCPTRLKLEFVDKLEREPTLSMQYGNYFETKVLGANRDGKKTDQLPLTPSTQKKSATHLRIDDMAHVFLTEIVPTYMLDLRKAHVELDTDPKNQDGFGLIAHLDLVSPILDPTIDPDNVVRRAIIDTKLVESMESDYGYYNFGSPEKMDHLQAIFYDIVWQEMYQEIVPFYYFICEHGTGREWKVIRKKVNDLDRTRVWGLIMRTGKHLQEWSQKTRFPILPNYKDCKNCPIKDSCEGYRIGRSVQVV